MRNLFILFGLILSLSCLSFATASISGCQIVENSTDAQYQLSANLGGATLSVPELSGSACLIVNSSNIVLDCNGYNIINDELPGSTSKMGIYINKSTTTNVTIRDCQNISQYKYAIYVNSADRNTFVNNTFYYNREGVHLYWSDLNNISSNEFSASTFIGLYFDSSDYNRIYGNRFNQTSPAGLSTGIGISVILGSDYSNFTDNIFYKGNDCIWTGAAYNRWENNSISACANGIVFSGGWNNLIIGNNISSTTITGVSVGGASSGLFDRNTFFNTSGIILNAGAGQTNITNNLFDGRGASRRPTVSNSGSVNRIVNNTFQWSGGIESYNAASVSIINNTLNHTSSGIMVGTSSNTHDVLGNRVEHGENYCYSIYASYDSNLTDNYGYNCSSYGLMLYRSGRNRIVNNTIIESGSMDLYMDNNNAGDCDNYFENLTGSGYRQVIYSNVPLSLTSQEISELVLCNASGSVIDDVDIHGSDSKDNNGIFLWFVNDSVIKNTNSSDGVYGINAERSSKNNFTGNIFNGNGVDGVRVRGDFIGGDIRSTSNRFIGNTMDGNGENGVTAAYLTGNTTFEGNRMCSNGRMGVDAGYVILRNNTICDNGQEDPAYPGILLDTAAGSSMQENEVYGQGIGLVMYSTADFSSTRDHYFNNSVDMVARNGIFAPVNLTITNTVFDNPLGNMQNYSNITINDTVSGSTEYEISWTAQPAPLPPNAASFAGKFFDITPVTGPVAIDRLTWSWNDAELGTTDESALQMWEYSGAAWTELGATLDGTANTMTATNLVPASEYALLESIPTPEEGGEKMPTSGEFDVSIESVCNGFIVTVESEGEPVQGAFVDVTALEIATHASSLGSAWTDEDGHATFTGICGIDARVKASKSGVSGEESGFIECGFCAECQADSDCLETERCLERQCVPVDCPEGQVVDHRCEYGCQNDADCQFGEACVGHTCVRKYGCTSDSDCTPTKFCDIQTGQSGGTCEDVSCDCGKAVNHACVDYECCSDSQCENGKICIKNKCSSAFVACPSTGLVGDDKTCNAKEDGDVCSGCNYQITAPNGKTYVGVADEDGNFVVPLELRGTYRVELLRDGQVVRMITMEAYPRLAFGDDYRPTTTTIELGQALFLVIMVVVLVVALAYLRRKGERFKPNKGP
jgi:parallel beta-helix repeat protein